MFKIIIALKSVFMLKWYIFNLKPRKVNRRRWEKIFYTCPVQIKDGVALLPDKIVAKKHFKKKYFLIIKGVF